MNRSGLEVFEAACGDGMTSAVLGFYGHKVTCNDLRDRRDRRAADLPFAQCDICQPIALEPDRFDLVLSYNSFEHLHDPAAALHQLARICKPGGLIHLQFAPLWGDAFGVHQYRWCNVPYTQFLFSEAVFMEKKRQLQKPWKQLPEMNRWPVGRYMEVWEQSGLEQVIAEYGRRTRFVNIISKYPESFRGRGLTFEDVTTESIRITFRKGDVA